MSYSGMLISEHDCSQTSLVKNGGHSFRPLLPASQSLKGALHKVQP